MPDARSGRVVFASQCLEPNTRYLGGAVCPGVVVNALEPFMSSGVGIVQMRCPEQQIWGGVLKRRLLCFVDQPRVARGGRLSGLVIGCIRLRYRLIATTFARDMGDYVKGGFEVDGVIGVSGSPSCGVTTTVDLNHALKAIGSCPRSGPTTVWVNRSVVSASTKPGQASSLKLSPKLGGYVAKDTGPGAVTTLDPDSAPADVYPQDARLSLRYRHQRCI